jgi:hypothetical protein
MQNELIGNLRSEFEMVLRLMEDHDRLVLQVRVKHVTASKVEGVYGCVTQFKWAANGKPQRCEIILNPVTMRKLNFKDRLSVMAHEIGHVLTMTKDTGNQVGEFLADQYARDLGLGTYSGLREHWNNMRRPFRYEWRRKANGVEILMLL